MNIGLVCCVYHKPRKFDESSSDDSSDSDSDASCGGHGHSHGGARRARPRRRPHHHHHNGDGAEGGEATRSRETGGKTVVHELPSDEEEVNRYEKGPGKSKKGKGTVRE